ncbi:MAG: hypothetical protein GVY06_02050 [Alphaproteobacteria bacterium]|jgi:hypothetical protein|nr:hypothetical protein [Alphaproteobacteria bacterium]
MLKLARLLFLIALAAMVARPVMACCLTGHGAGAAVAAESDMPPCHGPAPAAGHAGEALDRTMPAPPDCPGCLDCDTAFIKAQTVNDAALIEAGPSEGSLAGPAARFSGFEPSATVFKTGPPGDPPRAHATPVTLRQRLLI